MQEALQRVDIARPGAGDASRVSGPLARVLRALTFGRPRSPASTPRRIVWRMDAPAPVDAAADVDSGFADTVPAGPVSSGWLMSSMDLVTGVEVVESRIDDAPEFLPNAPERVDPESMASTRRDEGFEDMPTDQPLSDDVEPLRQAYRQLQHELATARLGRLHLDPGIDSRIEELVEQLAALARRIALLAPRSDRGDVLDEAG